MNNPIFSKGVLVKRFGSAYPNALVDADSVYNTLVGNVYFEPAPTIGTVILLVRF
jgi:hypothetical protein